jgi:hypothetical protein
MIHYHHHQQHHQSYVNVKDVSGKSVDSTDQEISAILVRIFYALL